MVNYSKWDKIDVSDDEDTNKPRVQRFDAPQSVTIGGGEVHIAPQTADEQHEGEDEPMEPDDDELENMEPGTDLREDVLQCRALAERALKRGDAAEGVRLLEKAMRMGGASCPGLQETLQSARRQAGLDSGSDPSSSSIIADKEPQRINGGIVGDKYTWSQTKETVEIGVFVPTGTKAKDVNVQITDTSLSVAASGKVAIAGDWEFRVAPEEDPDWEMKEIDGRRAVQVTVRKAVMPGGLTVVVWWSRLLKGEPAINLDEIQGRKRAAATSMQKAWDEAHIKFRESVKTREKIPVHVGEQEEVVAMDAT